MTAQKFILSVLLVSWWLPDGMARADEPIHISFLWHMHQPIYYPYENPIQVDQNNRFSFSVVDVHNQRFGPYKDWPNDAIGMGLRLPHFGAVQVSFSGSLIENLNSLEAGGVNGGMWNGWRNGYNRGRSWRTTLSHHRLELVAFGYHHPLMSLLDEEDLRMQIRLHKLVYGRTWSGGSSYSNGMFPPETAFATRVIPLLAEEGLDWIIVDNLHIDRACVGYPHTNNSGLFAPNPADQINPDPSTRGGAWVQLQHLWAPSKVSAPFGYQPHQAQHVDPDTGEAHRIIVVPAAHYEGHEDGRGGFGALQYEQVMDQYLQHNADASHPMLVLLHHDGDNFGGGSDSYYHHNFQNMVNWVSGNSDYDVSTVSDYLERFPPSASDVIHVENGSWAGADGGDPEFKKWLGDPNENGWSPDRNSWAVLTAAKNRVFTADALQPTTDMEAILNGTGSNTAKAWHWLLVSEASDYWYWDGTQIWDSNVTRGCNEAVRFADRVIGSGSDKTPPTVFVPQREPYNPGGFEWSGLEDTDFTVWTFAYDLSDLQRVTLNWRIDRDGVNPLASTQNETYAGGDEVRRWRQIEMTASDVDPPGQILRPTYRAKHYAATIGGTENVLIDYFVEAVDGEGNVRRSDIQHVFVGSDGSESDRVAVDPNPARAGRPAQISYNPSGGPLQNASRVFVHYGFDDWATVIDPDPLMVLTPDKGRWEITVDVPSSAWQLDVVFHDGAGTWDNNNGQDWHFAVEGGGPDDGWIMDGVLDEDATEVARHNGIHLWAGLKGDSLYVAAHDAGEGNDHFIYLARTPGALRDANWAKSGRVASWSAFLADENDNDYEAWFDAEGTNAAATGPDGGVIEGTIELAEEFGALPAIVHLAVGVYETADGGRLLAIRQVPPTVNGDGNLDAEEYVRVKTRDIRVPRDPTRTAPGDGTEPDDVSPKP